MKAKLTIITLSIVWCFNAMVYGKQVETKLGFPDFGFMLTPTEYQGRVFLLSQNYPETLPAVDKGVEKILSIDFNEDWESYILAVRDYIFEGNLNQDSTD